MFKIVQNSRYVIEFETIFDEIRVMLIQYAFCFDAFRCNKLTIFLNFVIDSTLSFVFDNKYELNKIKKIDTHFENFEFVNYAIRLQIDESIEIFFDIFCVVFVDISLLLTMQKIVHVRFCS